MCHTYWNTYHNIPRHIHMLHNVRDMVQPHRIHAPLTHATHLASLVASCVPSLRQLLLPHHTWTTVFQPAWHLQHPLNKQHTHPGFNVLKLTLRMVYFRLAITNRPRDDHRIDNMFRKQQQAPTYCESSSRQRT